MIYLQAEIVVKANYYNANLQVSNIGFVGGESYKFDGHDVSDCFIGTSAKYKPTSAVAVYSVADKLVFTQALKGNEEDKKVSNKLLDLIEEELRNI